MALITWAWSVLSAVDWGELSTWLAINAGLGAGAPLLGMGAMRGLNKMTENQEMPLQLKIDFFAPYRDAQLGYVVTVWAISAMAEVSKSKVSDDYRTASIVGSVLLALAGGFLAAYAASNPPKALVAGVSRWKHYHLFRVSFYLSVLTLGVAAYAHVHYGGQH